MRERERLRERDGGKREKRERVRERQRQTERMKETVGERVRVRREGVSGYCDRKN